jgi:hypothetical protein
MSFARRFIPLVFAFAALSGTVQGVTLDWDSVTWAAGTLSHAYDIDATKPGNDITVTVSGNTAQLTTELVSPNPMTPALTKDFQGGLGAAQNTLSLAVNFTNQSQSITVTVDFSSQYTLGVNNVSFTIFDVDLANGGGNNFQDKLSSITALSTDGVTLIAATITTSADNTLTGSGTSQIVNGIATSVDTGPGSGNGNVTISFGTTAIKSFTFTYGSGSGGGAADPTYQHIGVHDITFTPVPEINPAWSALGSCLLAAALILRHSAKFRK